MGSTIVAGERSLVGKYRNIFSAGEVHVDEGEIGAIYGAGEIDICKSKVKKVRAAGSLRVNQSSLGDVSAVGEANLTGVTEVQCMTMRGVLTAECMTCQRLITDNKVGKANRGNGDQRIDTLINGFVKVEILENYADLNMDFEHEIKHIVNCGSLSITDEISAECIYSFGRIESTGLNAEKIYIRPSADSKIGQVVGTHIQITKAFEFDKFLKSIAKKHLKKQYEEVEKQEVSIMSVESIEGDEIKIDHVKAESVSGISVEIGDLCIIERVEYSGAITISPKAIVNEVVRVC
ncbi:MAG: hypothetical protein ACRCW2_03740 [Cellulosilyticaceae bacterium]